MNINGLTPIGFTDRPAEQPLQFRLNQRVTAEILNVNGDQVNMVIQGARVVAKIIGGDQAANLSERRLAQFIVRGMTDGVLMLQTVKAGDTTAITSQTNQWSVLAKNLLSLNGIEQTDENMTVARALLSRGLPVTADLLDELTATLKGLGSWGQPEAELAAAFKAGGLPLSSGSMLLALRQLPSFHDALSQLESQMSRFMRSTTSPQLFGLVKNALNMLEGAKLGWNGNPANLMEQLPNVIAMWGKSVEAGLASMLERGSNNVANDPEGKAGLLALANLRGQLAMRGEHILVSELDRFIDSVRQMQLFNTGQSSDPTNPPWLVVNLPLAAKQSQLDQHMYPANLRIAYQSNDGDKEVDVQNTRLVLTIDLDEGDYLQADLSLIGSKIGAWMTVPNTEWQNLVQKDMPELQERLEALGFNIQFARCDVKPVQTESPMNGTVEAGSLSKINLEV